MEERTIKIQKNGGNRWGRRARFEVVKIAMEPRWEEVPVQVWTKNTS